MFASRITTTVQTPSDPSYKVTIRALSGRAKERCQQATLHKAATMVQQMGGAAMLEQIQKMGGEKAVKDEVEDKDPTAGFDRDQVLIDGVVSWSAKEPVTPETLADLESDTSEILFLEILKLSNVAVTANDKKRQDKKRKNG